MWFSLLRNWTKWLLALNISDACFGWTKEKNYSIRFIAFAIYVASHWEPTIPLHKPGGKFCRWQSGICNALNRQGWMGKSDKVALVCLYFFVGWTLFQSMMPSPSIKRHIFAWKFNHFFQSWKKSFMLHTRKKIMSCFFMLIHLI